MAAYKKCRYVMKRILNTRYEAVQCNYFRIGLLPVEIKVGSIMYGCYRWTRLAGGHSQQVKKKCIVDRNKPCVGLLSFMSAVVQVRFSLIYALGSCISTVVMHTLNYIVRIQN